MTETELSALVDRVKALEQTVEDLLAGGVQAEPEIRVRISHAHTLKDGWRCDSTTVEWTGRGPVNWATVGDELHCARIAGQREADARNAEAAAAYAVAS